MTVKFAKHLLNLDEEYFKQLPIFIKDLEKESSLNKDDFLYQFIKSINSELNKKRKHFIKPAYYFFIDKYRCLLKQLVEKGILTDIKYWFMLKNKKMFKLFLSYLCDNYDNKDKMLANLNKLEQLGIKKFKFSLQPLDNSVRVEIQNNGYYRLKSFYSDGIQEWEKDKNGYHVEINNHTFILKYVKDNTRGLCNLEITLTSLEFDISTLPTYEELYDVNKWQYIDIKAIEEKMKAIDRINKLIMDSNQLEKLLDQILLEVKEISLEEKDYNKFICQLKDCKKISEFLIELSNSISLNYQKSNIISMNDIKKYIKL